MTDLASRPQPADEVPEPRPVPASSSISTSTSTSTSSSTSRSSWRPTSSSPPRTGDGGRIESVLLALLAGLTAVLAACSWRPLYADPHTFLIPGAAITLVTAGIGWAGRARGLRPWAVLGLQLVLDYVLLALWFGPAHGHRGLGDLGALAHALDQGARQINAYSSPAPARFVDVRIFLCACTVLLAISIDLIACGMRRAPLSGLGVLLAVTVPISVLSQRLSPWIFLTTGAAFLALLAVAHRRELRSWGRRVSTTTRERAPLLGAGIPIAITALLAALAVSYVVPVPGGLFHGNTDSSGGGGNRSVSLGNPMIDLRRDLIQMSHTPIVTARTDDPDPSYVQLTVLDQFTGAQWRASDRHLPAADKLPGPLPPAPGLGEAQAGSATHWQLRLADTFHTSWLPVPSPATHIRVGGDWRYDARTLDVVDVGQDPTSSGLAYTVDAFHPQYDATVLDEAGAPLGPPVDGMTDLPRNLPTVITRVAKQVTAGASTEYQKLAALQQWFRVGGGFRYSTQPAPGSGMALLAAFITHDKVGYCEQFAAAMAVMGRTLGIPSRVVVGLLRPTGKASTPGDVEFTTDDLHAWPEFYFAGSGWVTFDPTPGARTGVAPAYTRQQVHSSTPTTGPSATAQPTAKPSSHKPSVLPQQTQGGHKAGASSGWAWWLLVPVLVVAGLVPRALRSRQRRRRLAATDPRGLATGCWEELRATARDLGIGWVDGRSPRQSFAVLRSRVTADVTLAADLDWLCGLVERAWYSPVLRASAPDLDRARRIVATWSEQMRQIAPERSARRARWLAPTLFERS